MISERIYLYEEHQDVYLDVFVCETTPELSVKKRPAVLIFPGGAYRYTSDREAEPIARAYLAQGFNAAILRYTTSEHNRPVFHKELGLPYPLLEASRAVCLIKDNAEKWFTDKEKIAVVGFSAGGHLAASLGILWHLDAIADYLGIEKGYNRPDFMLPIYPVISGTDHPNAASFQNLLDAESPDRTLLERFSLETRVDENTVPAFIFHTFNDTAVPVQNSLLLAGAMAKYKIPFELHILPDGPHGMSLATDEVSGAPNEYNGRWVSWSAAWLKQCFAQKNKELKDGAES